jgi:hypothetical protein
MNIVLPGEGDGLAVIARNNLSVSNIGHDQVSLKHVGHSSGAAGQLTIGL